MVRGFSVMYEPTPAGVRTEISRYRPLPSNALTPKSSDAANRPLLGVRFSVWSVGPICVPPVSASNSRNSTSAALNSGRPWKRISPCYVNAVPGLASTGLAVPAAMTIAKRPIAKFFEVPTGESPSQKED